MAFEFAADVSRREPRSFRSGTESIERTQESVVGRRTTGAAYDIGIATRELWTYDRESGAFPARLTIEEGVAIKIELLTER